MMIQRAVVAGIIIKRNSVLLIKRNKNEKHFPCVWELPSGKVEYKEDPNKAVIREVKEETGLNVKIVKLLSVHHFMIDKRHCIQINYLVKSKNYKVKLSEEHEDYKWATKYELKKLNTYKDTFKDIRNVALLALKN